MKTIRKLENGIMPLDEKEAFRILIRRMPWLYSGILNSVANITYSSLCDVACGDGYLLEQIASRNPTKNLCGIDIDPWFIEKARIKQLSCIVADAFDLQHRYDVITLNLALHHFNYPRALVDTLLRHTNCFLVISDQLRPEADSELTRRMELRQKMVEQNDVAFYNANERNSILEAYSKREILDIFSKYKCNLSFTDTDYYERYVCMIRGEMS